MVGLGSLIGNAIGLAGSIYGGVKASQAAKKVKKNIEGQQRENQDWFDRRYNEDATQRADAQRILRITADNIRNRNRAAAGAAAVSGATEESVAATKAANAEAMAEAASQIAAQGEARKDAIEQEYKQRDATLQGQLNNIESQRAAAITQAAGGLAQAAGSAGAAYDDATLEAERLGVLKNLVK